MLKLIKRFGLEAVINSEEIKIYDNEKELIFIDVERKTITFNATELTLTFIKELMETLERTLW